MTDWKVTPMDAIDAEDATRLMKRVQKLPEITRQVVTLRKTYGLSQDEIAERLNITPERVMDELTKAVHACADIGEIDDN